MTDETEKVVVAGKPLDADDRGLDNTPDVTDPTELAQVKAEDRREEERQEAAADAVEKVGEAPPQEVQIVKQEPPQIAAPAPTKTVKLPSVKKAEKSGEYEVQGGENLLDIANKFGISIDQLATINGLTTGNRNPAPGTKIKLYEA